MKEMLTNLCTAVETVGYLNPMNKVYQLTKPLESMSLFLAIYTMAQIQKLMYDHKLCTLRRPPSRETLKAGEFMLDGPHLMVGLITVFR